MDHTEIKNELIVERYVAGQLPVEDAARFEDHYLTCGECVDHMETAGRLRTALKGVAAEDAGVAARLGIFAAVARLRRSRQLSLAAVAVVMLLLPVGLLRLDTERSRLTTALAEAGGPRAVTSVLRLEPERSAASADGPVQRITLSEAPDLLLLSLTPDDPGYGAYHLTLVAPGGETVWTDELTIGPRGSLDVSLPSSFLVAGDYRVGVEGVAPGEPLVRLAAFSFRVIR